MCSWVVSCETLAAIMPPYTPVTSKAQSRKLFALANRGEISEDDAKGKTRAADWDKLPKRKRGKVRTTGTAYESRRRRGRRSGRRA